MVHGFSGTSEALGRYLALDCHIGLTGGICDERRGTHRRELVPRSPKDRVMTETDAPYILPRDIRPEPSANRNEPSLLPWPRVLRAVAKARGETAEELTRATTETANAFFGITDRA